ncbi:MAG: phospho-N-acetylmuramoyl-pentapeptide-transferase [Nitrospinota bacterium]|nr:phospho-N-acetylmuramoyl-pentapeptide-transferase [Nitrospinota bacterium]
MMYELLYPLHEQYQIFNVFRYITFRTTYAVITAVLLSFLLGPLLIGWLKRKELGERIREDAPAHHNVKAGTPTMGGLLIIISSVIPCLLWMNYSNRFMWAALLAIVLFGMLGAYDDLIKMRHGNGLSAKKYFLLQVLACVPVLWIISGDASYNGMFTNLYIPFFKNLQPDLSWGYYVFAILVIVGSSNAVNLTDGLDGLAIGPIIIAFSSYLVITYVSGHAGFAEYLQIPFIKGAGELAVLCGAVVGASLGFLWYNAYPAQIFMGNTGSVSMGALLGTIAVMTKNEIILILVGGIFVVEALSVIIQVVYYKATRKRVFLMAPLHHHFEKKGWAEPKVIIRFWIIAILLALISLSTLKLR